MGLRDSGRALSAQPRAATHANFPPSFIAAVDLDYADKGEVDGLTTGFAEAPASLTQHKPPKSTCPYSRASFSSDVIISRTASALD